MLGNEVIKPSIGSRGGGGGQGGDWQENMITKPFTGTEIWSLCEKYVQEW